MITTDEKLLQIQQKLLSVETKLQYQFTNKQLLEQAMTHCSSSGANNERLEYLGDSFINFVVAQWLYTHPAYSEAELSRARAFLVSRCQLARYAQSLEIDKILITDKKSVQALTSKSESLISDAFEALWGAILLDCGFNAAQDLFSSHYLPLMKQRLETAVAKDPKTHLQEICQARYKKLPAYALMKQEGQGHQLEFTVCCRIERFETQGQGRSIKEAQGKAAYQMLKVLD